MGLNMQREKLAFILFTTRLHINSNYSVLQINSLFCCKQTGECEGNVHLCGFFCVFVFLLLHSIYMDCLPLQRILKLVRTGLHDFETSCGCCISSEKSYAASVEVLDEGEGRISLYKPHSGIEVFVFSLQNLCMSDNLLARINVLLF